MAAEFDLMTHVRNAMAGVIAAIGISIAFGIGYYILVQLNEAAKAGGANLSEAVKLLAGETNLIGTAITFIIIGVVAGIGIGLVLYLQSRFGLSGK